MHDLILLAEAALATFADEHEAIRVFAENTRPPQLMPFARPRHPPIGEHPLQRPIADALRLEVAPPGEVSCDGVVWWSVEVVHFCSVEDLRQREAELVSADDKADAA